MSGSLLPPGLWPHAGGRLFPLGYYYPRDLLLLLVTYISVQSSQIYFSVVLRLLLVLYCI